MFPTVFLALPLLLPMSNPVIGPRNDIVTSVALTATTTSENRVASSAASGPLIPPLYTGADGGFSLLLS
ncbi:MAG: hypothetical protein ABUL60_11270, partial [Myxococcales bacterium]